jgi:hypothetical protein
VASRPAGQKPDSLPEKEKDPMGLFGRISDIISANLNEMIDRFEDPEKMLKQAIREMEDAIGGARRETARAMAAEKLAGGAAAPTGTGDRRGAIRTGGPARRRFVHQGDATRPQSARHPLS